MSQKSMFLLRSCSQTTQVIQRSITFYTTQYWTHLHHKTKRRSVNKARTSKNKILFNEMRLPILFSNLPLTCLYPQVQLSRCQKYKRSQQKQLLSRKIMKFYLTIARLWWKSLLRMKVKIRKKSNNESQVASFLLLN